MSTCLRPCRLTEYDLFLWTRSYLTLLQCIPLHYELKPATINNPKPSAGRNLFPLYIRGLEIYIFHICL